MKKVFETFREVGSYEERNLTENEPSCFNGVARFRKFRITFEEIEEPAEILQERLQKLWDESDNYHDHDPLQKAAKEIGYKFLNSRGSKRKK